MYSYWNISLFYYNMSGHQICVWAQTHTFLFRHDYGHTIITCQGTNMCGHNRVGTNMCGHKRVWAQSCGLKYVWAQTCGLQMQYNTIINGKSFHAATIHSQAL